MRRRCLHCTRARKPKLRGLCRRCYDDPAVRPLYPARGRGWTRAEEIRACSLRWCGEPVAQIAAALGRSDGSVRRKLLDLGLYGPQRPKGELMRLVKVFAAKGWYDWEIALELDVAANTVAHARHRAGIRANHKVQSQRAKGRKVS